MYGVDSTQTSNLTTSIQQRKLTTKSGAGLLYGERQNYKNAKCSAICAIKQRAALKHGDQSLMAPGVDTLGDVGATCVAHIKNNE